MYGRIVLSLTEVRRQLDPGQVARRFGDSVQIYMKSPNTGRTTPERALANENFASGAALWTSLSPAKQAAWKRYREEFAHLLRDTRNAKAPAAHLLYTACATRLLLLGHDAPTDPPRQPRPEPVTSVTVEPSDDPRTFRFRVVHPYAAPVSLRLLVKITPATTSPGRKPHAPHARLICGPTSASTCLLPPSGEVALFENARYPIPPGQRFGLLTQILHPTTGLASLPHWADLYR